MSIQTTQQLETTRSKLELLKERMAALEAEPVVNPHTRALTRRSLQKLINQLEEEIARFQIPTASRA